MALSSAGAELVATARAVAEGVAVASLLRVMGHAGAVQVKVDFSAVLDICKRTGVGKLRRWDTHGFRMPCGAMPCRCTRSPGSRSRWTR